MLQVDARLNEWLGSLDAINNNSLTDPRTAVSTLNAVNGEVFMDLQGKAIAVFDVRAAAANLTFVFEGTMDGTNYYQLPGLVNSSAAGPTGVTPEAYVMSVAVTATITASFTVGTSGWRRVRCRVSSFTSGSITVSARASVSDQVIYARPLPALLNVSQAPAANTGATITLPAGGAGLFHYITNFQCTIAMNPATAQTGAAPVFVTTTNLPGTPAWAVPICGNAIASTGGLSAAGYVVTDTSWANPLKSSVANTATTFVLPAPGAACTIRGNVQYYLGA